MPRGINVQARRRVRNRNRDNSLASHRRGSLRPRPRGESQDREGNPNDPCDRGD